MKTAGCQDKVGEKPSESVRFKEINQTNYSVTPVWRPSIYSSILNSSETDSQVSFTVGTDTTCDQCKYVKHYTISVMTFLSLWLNVDKSFLLM